jgi:transcriptional regulator with XRE-family HTH domain
MTISPLAAVVVANLRREMSRAKLSQSALAKRAGIRRATLCDLLRERHEPTLPLCQSLADALGINPAKFFRDSANCR